MTYLRKGDYAGETALLLDEPWPFTLQALEHVELVKLTRERLQRGAVASTRRSRSGCGSTMIERLKERGAAVARSVGAQPLQMAMETGLIHGESVLLIDLSTCTRCDECVRGCADAHGGEPRFIREGAKYRN